MCKRLETAKQKLFSLEHCIYVKHEIQAKLINIMRRKQFFMNMEMNSLTHLSFKYRKKFAL